MKTDNSHLWEDLNAEMIARRLHDYRPGERGDHSLNPGREPPPPHRQASVLVPLIRRQQGLSVLFTKRTAHLTTHAGQVSFPGGGVEEGDADDVATALREAQEEIGLEPQGVKILGRLDRYLTRTGFMVKPVVGLCDPPHRFILDSFEVEHVFEVPLSYVMAPGNLARREVLHEGAAWRFYAMTWNEPPQEFLIWGATAGMLKNMTDALQ